VRQRALCILGVHRSGTSAVTRSFNLFGAYVGDKADLLPESQENPLGFWERDDIFSFHERLLASLHCSWSTGLILPDGWQRSPEVAPYREELKRIVGAAFAGRALWAWKDPRSCILLDLWKEVLQELEIDLNVVIVVRHPRAVAASLGKRDGFGTGKGYRIWLSHTLAALRSCEGVPTAFIEYDRFLEDPDRHVRRCAEILGLSRSDEAGAVSSAIRGFVRKDLRHNLAAADYLEALASPVREVYELIRQASENPATGNSSFFGRIRELHRQYCAYAGFFREDLEQCLTLAGEFEKSEARCRETYERASAAEQKAAEAGRRVAETERRAEGAEAYVRVLEAQVRALELQSRETARALEQIVTSKIWRITGPVRKAADLFQKLSRTSRPPEK
jgi:hypothetical protein